MGQASIVTGYSRLHPLQLIMLSPYQWDPNLLITEVASALGERGEGSCLLMDLWPTVGMNRLISGHALAYRGRGQIEGGGDLYRGDRWREGVISGHDHV